MIIGDPGKLQLKIADSPIRPKNEIHSGHYFLHFAAGLIVFLAGIAADVTIVHWLHNRPHTVRWQNGETQTGWRRKDQEFNKTNIFEFGMTEDGSLVWRQRPAQ